VALRTIVALVLIGFITHSTNAGSGDEPHYLAIAHSIAFDGDLDLANNYGANEALIAAAGWSRRITFTRAPAASCARCTTWACRCSLLPSRVC
jgi:hypothetical protein